MAPRPDGLPFERVALVLQGGGALGAYQGGVVEGLCAAHIQLDWVAGVSIGALNAALIAGNPPERRVQRLHEFWDTVCQPAFFQPTSTIAQAAIEPLGGRARRAFNAFHAWRAMTEGQRGFFVPRGPQVWWQQHAEPGEASFYDLAPLHDTLRQLVDFERLNGGETRVSVLAVNVATGNLDVFDNTSGPWQGRLQPEHFMASGALPPGFPPVQVGDAWYWDGGLLSNTPLSLIVDDRPQRDTLAFQVDLWSALGPLPANVYDAAERAKDIQYSSRTRQITDRMQAEQRQRRLLRDLLAQLPPEALEGEACREAQALQSDARFAVVHLIYQEKEWDGLQKDYEFGPLTMRDHWASGLEDVQRSLAGTAWRRLPGAEQPFVTYDVRRGRTGL